MSTSLKLEDLVGRGYFPHELPPPFTSVSLGNYVKSLSSGRLPFDVRSFKTSKSEVYNLARAGSLRRELAILNPIHFSILAECIVQNWPELLKLTSSTISLTSPILTPEHRALAKANDLEVLPIRRPHY